jgi:glycosyltransferase involved in cell wall biosynthesis
MKILMIAPQPFFEPRGTPISVYQRLSGLSSLGHTIDLATYHLGKNEVFEGVTIHRTPSIPFIKSLKVGPSWQKVPLDILLFLKSVGLLIKNKYDVIHSHEEAGFFSVLLAWMFRKRHLYDMHSSLPKQLVNFKFGDNWLMIGFFDNLERLVVNTCDAMITIGPDLAEHVQEINPRVPMQMIENLPLVSDEVDVEVVEQLKEKLGLVGKIVIVYTGTFERYQGVDLLIDSVDIVIQQYPEVKFILVGGKPNQIEELKNLVVNKSLDKSVRFMGTVPIEEANTYIEMADILVSPRTEGTSVPLKIYTYLWAGKPIIATNLTAHTLVLDQESAVLVEPTKESLASGLVKLISSESLRKTLGEQSRKLVEEKYSKASYLSKLQKIYEVLQTDSHASKKSIEVAEN